MQGIKLCNYLEEKANNSDQRDEDTASEETVKRGTPNFNTHAGEQTFVWTGRFRHILCTMNKTHHCLFAPYGEMEEQVH